MSDGTIELTVKGKSHAQMEMAGGSNVTMTIGTAHGTSYYPALIDKPSIEGVTLIGNKTLPEIGVGLITPQDIDNLIYG